MRAHGTQDNLENKYFLCTYIATMCKFHRLGAPCVFFSRIVPAVTLYLEACLVHTHPVSLTLSHNTHHGTLQIL